MWPDFDPDSMAAYCAEQEMLDVMEYGEDPRGVTCKFCHWEGFFWEERAEGWRLVTRVRGQVHRCKAYWKLTLAETAEGV